MHVKALPVQVIQGYIEQPLASPLAVANANSHALSYLCHKNSDLHGNCAVIMHPLHLCVHACVSVRVTGMCCNLDYCGGGLCNGLCGGDVIGSVCTCMPT